MISFTSNFKKYFIFLLATIIVGLIVVSTSTEILIRKLVLPNDRVIKSVALFHHSKIPNAAFGDSHVGTGFKGSVSWVNLGYSGENPATTLVKVVNYFSRIKPKRVILEADPEYLNRFPRAHHAFLFKNYSLSISKIWFWDPIYRPYIFKLWKTYFVKGKFRSRNVFTPTGWFYDSKLPKWVNLSSGRRKYLIQQRLDGKFPRFFDNHTLYFSHLPAESIKLRSIKQYKKIIKFLRARGTDVCLVVFPHANDFIEIANNMSIYNYSLNYVKKLAQSDHISFVNLTAVFKNHQEYFADMSHLDPAGAKALMPILIKNCFEKNSNPTTGP